MKDNEAAANKGSQNMKLFTVAFIPVVSALILGSAFMVHDEYDAAPLTDNPAADESYKSLRYIMVWNSGSFDEALWLAMNQVATLEDGLPQQVDRFQVEIQSKGTTQPTVQLAFSRTDFTLLKAGAIAPEVFMRDYVRYH